MLTLHNRYGSGTENTVAELVNLFSNKTLKTAYSFTVLILTFQDYFHTNFNQLSGKGRQTQLFFI
jgi:hypothetical protein